jgi:predicted DNA-binding protein
MAQEQKTTSIRLKMEHYRFLKESAEKSNRTISGQANWLLEIVWHLEETKNQVFNEIVSELTEPEYPLPSVKIRRK